MKVTKDDVFEAAMAFWNADMAYISALERFDRMTDTDNIEDTEYTRRIRESYLTGTAAYKEFFRIAKAFDVQNRAKV